MCAAKKPARMQVHVKYVLYMGKKRKENRVGLLGENPTRWPCRGGSPGCGQSRRSPERRPPAERRPRRAGRCPAAAASTVHGVRSR